MISVGNGSKRKWYRFSLWFIAVFSMLFGFVGISFFPGTHLGFGMFFSGCVLTFVSGIAIRNS